MDYHFGKYKFRSGNIPFTIFGPFDQKQNVLFKDTTDGFKTPLEAEKYTKFERSLETFYRKYQAADMQFCQNSSSIVKLNFYIAFIITAMLKSF